MPLFECPQCGKRYLVPLALCEWMMEDLPISRFDSDGTPVHDVPCLECSGVKVQIVEGDLLDQDVDVIVNAWNRNVVPWWLLLPQGVSRAIKKRAGTGPFKELRKHGPIPLGGAVLTSAGRLPFKGIIHVARIDMLWSASEQSIRDSVRNALSLAEKYGFRSIAFPLIGAGSGGFGQERAKVTMLGELLKLDSPLAVRIVTFKKAAT
jgi:O-acetyl-ADP-ribose deacetylase